MDGTVLTREQSRAVDRLAMDTLGISGLVLMENAGRGAVDELAAADPAVLDKPPAGVAVLCGRGNNAGDGFVVARHLVIRGGSPKVLLLSPPDGLRGDALANYQILRHCDVPIHDLSGGADLTAALDEHAHSAAWLVDALLGTGATGDPREPFATAILWMNRQEAKRLALDLPSGLDCDTGEASQSTVRADLTCTFVARKQGFDNPAAADHLGEVRVVAIGVPPSIVQQATAID